MLQDAGGLAQDFAKTLQEQANADMQNLKDIAKVGMSKITDFVKDFQNRY
jgi:hypothetical protein